MLPPLQNFVNQVGPLIDAAWLNAVDKALHGTLVAPGVYLAPFQAGYVMYAGPNDVGTGLPTFAANTNFLFGLALPNPAGVPAPGILVGGAGQARACIVTDEQILGQPGIDLLIAAGETQASGADNGGALFLFGGASFGGIGGATTLQGGTSLNGPGGDVTVAGGNSTNGAGGNVYVIGAQNGQSGGSVHLIATTLNAISGTINFRNDSTVLYQIDGLGCWRIAGSDPGQVGQALTSQGTGASLAWGPIQRSAFRSTQGTSLNNATPAPDSVLQFTAVPVGTYEVEGFLQFQGSVVGTQGFSMQLGAPALTGNKYFVWDGILNGSYANPSFATNLAQVNVATIATAQTDFIRFRAVFTLSAPGTISVNWSQRNIDAVHPTILNDRSYIKIRSL